MIKGSVKTIDSNPLQDVNIYYEKDASVGTTTNKKGEYSIPYHKDKGKIVFSIVGYKPDMVEPVNNTTYHATLEEGENTLPSVEIKTSSLKKNNEWWKWALMIIVLGVTATTIIYFTRKAMKK